MAARLESRGATTAVRSIDDFYLTRVERAALGREVHPLLETRGVPGTHDLDLARRTLDGLLGEAGVSPVPCIDKAIDDRAPLADWHQVRTPVSVLILEGWCVGARLTPEDQLEGRINELERDEDVCGRWPPLKRGTHGWLPRIIRPSRSPHPAPRMSMRCVLSKKRACPCVRWFVAADGGSVDHMLHCALRAADALGLIRSLAAASVPSSAQHGA
nr:hypothetical protein [uncultured Lichenicoccus sp.]